MNEATFLHFEGLMYSVSHGGCLL